ncbi:unnamed protein product [Paramecium sonneborni]|uniref:Uncharacterized protein n=1 Tax=Paramecium sonneborni TaxID=65129 RepID=A0A8S1RUJ7_9CILI|nr:unnamed protein product [Paramecium sonneborni]
MKQLNTGFNIEKQQSIQSNYSTTWKSFSQEIIEESQISQSDICLVIAIDNECSTLLAGCYLQIKVFEFNQGIIKQIQTLNEHKNWVHTLTFMKKSKQFISWKFRQFYNYMEIKLKQFMGFIIEIKWTQFLDLLFNLIISGSSDTTIKFWINKNEWLCQQTITDHSGYIYDLNLNQQQNRIVSCGHDKVILIIEQSEKNTEWNVIQKITVEKYGYRVCFIGNNMFIFSPYATEQISVFEMNNINKQFTKIRDITVKCGPDDQCLFPQQYVYSECILLSKNGEYVNLIRKQQNGEFLTEQSIHFGTTNLFGRMSEDGKYLITWDRKSNKIQIRKSKEL